MRADGSTQRTSSPGSALNAVHLMHEQIEEYAGRPVLSMIETTLSEVCRRGWKRVGVLTFLDLPVYTVPLRERGIVSETLPTEFATPLDQAIMRLAAGTETRSDRAVTKEAVQILRSRGVDGIILDCTEIPLLLQEEAADLINPLQLLAEATVKHALQ